MAAFDYIAITTTGNQTKGTLEGDSPRQIRQQLRERDLIPLEVTESAQQHKKQQKISLWGGGKSLSTKELALVTRQMSTLVQAALPLEEVLSAVAEQTETPNIRSIFLAVRSKILEGHSLAEALGEFPRAFPQLYRSTVAAGEHSGHLDRILLQLADHTEDSQVFRQKVQMAMVYPVLLVVLSLTIVIGLMTYVVPDVIKVFIASGQALPALTRGLVATSDFLIDYGLLLAIVIGVLCFGIYKALQVEHIKLNWHKKILHIIFVKRLSRGLSAARYISTLSILTRSGVPLVEAMKIAADVLDNIYLKQRVAQATQRVSEGISLNKSLYEVGYFPPIMLHMIASGEASGELDNMLERTAKYQERDLQALISTMVALLEPLMLVIMGITVLIIVMAILLPILNLNQLVT